MKLTETTEFGGCAAKAGVGDLRNLLSKVHVDQPDYVHVGLHDHDDAAVVDISGEPRLIQTIDFITPVVDSPYLYGAIAAANSLSDVYAMGGYPVSALVVACLDPRITDEAVWVCLLQGLVDKVAESGASTVGGHTILDTGVKVGLSVTGVLDGVPLRICNARVGDYIHLSKPIGSGFFVNALRQGVLSLADCGHVFEVMARLNSNAAAIARSYCVTCATDVTGFGLYGHLINVSLASANRIDLWAPEVPRFDGLEELVDKGLSTGGARRNKLALNELIVRLGTKTWLDEIFFDPQTSGGLAIFSQGLISEMPCIGRVVEGEPGISVRF